MAKVIFNVEPMGKPRMTQQDRWKKRKCVTKYWALKDEIKRNADELNYVLNGSVCILFNISMPKSWSKKKKNEFEGKPHQQRPDIDNLQKALFDSLADEDSYIWNVSAVKLWARFGSIEIINT